MERKMRLLWLKEEWKWTKQLLLIAVLREKEKKVMKKDGVREARMQDQGEKERVVGKCAREGGRCLWREMEGYCDHIGIISNGRMVIERDLEDLKSDVHKIQVAWREGVTQVDKYDELNVLHQETRGSVDLLIVRNTRMKIERTMQPKEPAILDILPLSLEEIFIYELGGESDEIRKVI